MNGRDCWHNFSIERRDRCTVAFSITKLKCVPMTEARLVCAKRKQTVSHIQQEVKESLTVFPTYILTWTDQDHADRERVCTMVRETQNFLQSFLLPHFAPTILLWHRLVGLWLSLLITHSLILRDRFAGEMVSSIGVVCLSLWMDCSARRQKNTLAGWLFLCEVFHFSGKKSSRVQCLLVREHCISPQPLAVAISSRPKAFSRKALRTRRKALSIITCSRLWHSEMCLNKMNWNRW